MRTLNSRRWWVQGGRHTLAGLVATAGLAMPVLAQQTPGTRLGEPELGRPNVARPAPLTDEQKKSDRPQAPAATPANQPDTETPSFTVGGFVIRYAADNPLLPSVDDLLKRPVKLGRTDAGYIAPVGAADVVTITIEDVSLEAPRKWTSRALFEVSKAILDEMNQLGVVGVTVSPSEREFAAPGQGDQPWGKDIRKPGQTGVTLTVRTGVVTEIRTLAFGERIPDDRRIDAPEHEWIKDNAPVQVYSPDDPERQDLLRKDELDNYIFRLNRHPGRRVDTAIAAGSTPGGIALDFLVNESKPWIAYFQVSNTGTKQTDEWRERFGFIHNQLTGADDILSLDYITASFDKTHYFSGSYDRPIWGDWLRLKVLGSYNKYTASDVGLGGEQFKGEGTVFGGELTANVYQHRQLFVDLVAGLRYENVKVNNTLLDVRGDSDFFLPSFGVRLETGSDVSATNASVDVQFNVSDVAGTKAADLERLGRTAPTEDFTILRWDLSHSFYLDPILFGARWKDTGPEGSPTLAHELALAFRGQTSFDDRLIPNEQQVLGGLYTVRGYPESVVAGDTVVFGTAEYRFHLPQALGIEPEPGTLFGQTFRTRPSEPYGRADWDLILKGFVDAGRALQSKKRSFERDQTLVGAGAGVEFVYRRNLTVRVDWGVALEEIENNVKEGAQRVHFSATLSF